jgi:hypothetical protein
VTAFSAIDLPDADPDAPAWLSDVHPDVVRNDDVAGRRTVILVLDDATPIPAAEAIRVRIYARQAIERLGPDDLAAVVYTLDKRKGQELTRDRARLRSAADRFVGGMGPSDPSAMTMYLATIRRCDHWRRRSPNCPSAGSWCSSAWSVPLDMGDLAPRMAVGEHGDSAGQNWRLLQELLRDSHRPAGQREHLRPDPGGRLPPFSDSTPISWPSRRTPAVRRRQQRPRPRHRRFREQLPLPGSAGPDPRESAPRSG